MKQFKLSLAYIVMFAMIFTSCSKEEAVQDVDSDMATLSFGAIVTDLLTNRAASKQAIGDMPACSDSDPAYVRVVLLDGNTPVVGTTGNPYRINLVPGQLYTVEDAELELVPDTYTLAHFAVYNAQNQLIWLAPRGGALANFVDNPLPIDIDLRAGVKKYVEVDVLCYDNREVNEYGYLFFEIEQNEAVEFCLFVNFCDEDGRHYPASYRVDVWLGTDATGTPLYTNATNSVGQYNNGDFYADALCGALPSNDDPDEDYIFLRITLLDWAAAYGDVDQDVIELTLSMDDIEDNFGGDGIVNYEHLRFGCE